MVVYNFYPKAYQIGQKIDLANQASSFSALMVLIRAKIYHLLDMRDISQGKVSQCEN